jgi:peptidoglycan LD-endopeptidase CwlK
MINSRKIEDLTPEAQAMFLKFKEAMDAAGIRFVVTSTYRDQEMQDYLWASGRTRKGPILTKVRHSRHQDREAWDIAIIGSDGVISWDVKVDADKDLIPDYLEAAKIGESLGLTAGGLYKGDFKDWPHYELSRG